MATVDVHCFFCTPYGWTSVFKDIRAATCRDLHFIVHTICARMLLKSTAGQCTRLTQCGTVPFSNCMCCTPVSQFTFALSLSCAAGLQLHTQVHAMHARYQQMVQCLLRVPYCSLCCLLGFAGPIRSCPCNICRWHGSVHVKRVMKEEVHVKRDTNYSTDHILSRTTPESMRGLYCTDQSILYGHGYAGICLLLGDGFGGQSRLQL